VVTPSVATTKLLYVEPG